MVDLGSEASNQIFYILSNLKSFGIIENYNGTISIKNILYVFWPNLRNMLVLSCAKIRLSLARLG